MSWTQTDLDAINEAIASGALTVRHADRTVTYDSLQSLLIRRDLIRKELGTKLIGSTYAYGSFSKGLK